ncbi:MAG: MopE-related protein [Pseudomonadota bacterium]|nr:MopE-related protein [Pseudomonadota bacterium]
MPRLLALLVLTGCSRLVVDFGAKDDPVDTGPVDTGPDEVVSGGLRVSPASADLGILFVGDIGIAMFEVENVGTGPLSITTEVASAFSDAWSYTLVDAAPAAGETTSLTLTLAPTVFGDHAAAVTLRDTAGSEGVVVLDLTALVQEDADGDGAGSLASGGADCDDTNPDAYPGASETWYDGVDGDCAGGDDYDQDGDGVQLESDCDDTDPEVYPGAEETWYDGVDGDCAGDDDFDQDADGAPLDTDCDDTDPTAFPGAPETWYDGVDSDCDGQNDFDQDHDSYEAGDDCDDLLATTYPGAPDPWYDGVDSDCAGNDDDDQDSDGVPVATDCDDTDATIGAPLTETWNDLDDDCDGIVDELAVDSVNGGVLYGSSSSLALGASHTMALGGDIDGDGGDDLIALSAVPEEGAAWVVAGTDAIGASGPIDGYDTAFLFADEYLPPAYISGPMTDLTGDSTDDVLLNGVSTYYGVSFVVDGDAAAGDLDLYDDYTAYVEGDSDYDMLRWSVGGDIDGDGVSELVVSAVYESYSYSSYYADYYAGNVSIFGGGGLAGGYDLNDADDQIWGADDYDYLGASLAIADVTGDGYGDILAGAPGNDDGATNAGAVYVLLGGSLAWVNDRVDTAAYTTVTGTIGSQAVGTDPLPTPGDLDGDGAYDLALSATSSGKAWVFFDLVGLSGEVGVTDADAIWSGTANSFTTSLAAAADLDNDGIDDLAIGASGDDTAAVNAGAVYLFLGGGAWTTAMTSTNADVGIYGTAASDSLGSGLAAGGDLDSDGSDDLLMGASGVDTVASGGGAVYVMLGR